MPPTSSGRVRPAGGGTGPRRPISSSPTSAPYRELQAQPPVVVVLEGVALRGFEEGVVDGVEVVHASGHGDDTIVAVAQAAAGPVTLVSADRALAERCRAVGTEVVGPGWLLDRIMCRTARHARQATPEAWRPRRCPQ